MSAIKPWIPPLQNGDRLTRDEFERRYAAMPPHIKAELIEGVVFTSSPVTFEDHGGPQFDLITWLGVYRIATLGVRGGDNSTIRLDLDNEPQPDACLFVLPRYGGRVKMEDKYIVGAPELVAEIAASSASYDMHAKLHAYRRNGVLEYVVWRVWDDALYWFHLVETRYERLVAEDGILKSKAFPGLWLDPEALISGDMYMVMQIARAGIASKEHEEFADRLRKAKG